MQSAADQNDVVMNNYTKEKKGTYADVFLGRQLLTGRKIAIKKIKIGQFPDGLDMSAIREVKFLQELRHANIVELIDVYSSGKNLNLVLEFLDTDLEAVIKDRALVFQAGDIKAWMLMTIKGLDFCHRNFVLHRDLKPNNLLISADGTLKLADFGLAREYADPKIKMSTQVVTRWYRPPELLMGARYYAGAVDIWAAGCIFAELLLRTPYLPGETDIQQLELIFKALGTPTEEDWPGFKKLAAYVPFPHQARPPLAHLFIGATPDTLALLGQMLTFNPLKRTTAKRALHHPYFVAEPRAVHPSKLPKPTAELAPRALPPDLERPAKHPLDDSVDADGQPQPKVARRLFH